MLKNAYTGRGALVVVLWVATATVFGITVGIIFHVENRLSSPTPLMDTFGFILSAVAIWCVSRNRLAFHRTEKGTIKVTSQHRDIFLGRDMEWWAIVTALVGVAYGVRPDRWVWFTAAIVIGAELIYPRLVLGDENHRALTAAVAGREEKPTLLKVVRGRFLSGRGIYVFPLIVVGLFVYGVVAEIVAHVAGMPESSLNVKNVPYLGGVGLLMSATAIWFCGRNHITFSRTTDGQMKISSQHRDVFVWTDIEWWAVATGLVGVSYFVFASTAGTLDKWAFALIAVIAGGIGGGVKAQE